MRVWKVDNGCGSFIPWCRDFPFCHTRQTRYYLPLSAAIGTNHTETGDMLDILRTDRIRSLIYLLTTLSAVIITLRYLRTGYPHYFFLLWNIFLALVPLWIGGYLVRAGERGSPGRGVQLTLLGLWLLFLPNAPYIVTDFVHVGSSPDMVRFDIVMIGTCALTGLLSCYRSIFDIERVTLPYLGSRGAGLFSAVALGLSGYGVYIGRVLRLNSWDAILHPIDTLHLLLSDLLMPITRYSPWTVTFVISTYLLLGYLVIRYEVWKPVWRLVQMRSPDRS